MIQRIALVLVALVAAGWMAVALRDARQQRHARQILREEIPALARGGTPNQARVAEAGRALENARLLNPDRTPEVERANQLFLAGRERAAVAQLTRVVEAEPDNIEAWARLAIAARSADPAAAAIARRKVDELDPRGAELRR